MSTIQTQAAIVHIESGLSLAAATQRTSSESTFSADSIEIGAVEETLDLGDVVTAQQVLIKFTSGDPLRVGTATGVYPFVLASEGECLLLRLDTDTPPTVYLKSDVTSLVVIVVAPV